MKSPLLPNPCSTTTRKTRTLVYSYNSMCSISLRLCQMQLNEIENKITSSKRLSKKYKNNNNYQLNPRYHPVINLKTFQIPGQVFLVKKENKIKNIKNKNKNSIFIKYCKPLQIKAVVCRCSSKQVFLKISGLQGCSFIKKRLQQRCFPVKFEKFLRTHFFTEHLRWLLLNI